MKKRLLMLLALLFLPLTACNNGGDNKGKEPVVNTVELDKTSATMKVGEELTLKATTNVEDPVLAWSTSNAQVALVNEGLVTAVGSGEADILVQVRGNGISAKCAITVLDATFINLSYEELVLEVGEKETVGFETNSKEEITWKVEKEDIVKINNKNESNIEIEALAVGESDITATVEGKSASCHVIVNTPITYLSVSEAIDVAKEVGEEGTKDRQFVTGIIKTVSNPTYGEMYITDGTNDLYIYGLYSKDGSIRYDEMEDKPYAGDEIFISGILKTYKDSPELGSSWLQKYISHQDEIDVSDYNEMNIATAREKEEGEKILLNGVVTFITYANGMKPQGIYLVDNTGSIYIYSVDIAGRVKIGDKVTVAGVKTYYILESEQGYAATYGYKGSCQLNGDYLVNISAHEQEFDKTWIKESTVKDILETSVGENITTSIFKVNAFINKVPGSGFVNYYINDLDNKTGSYCYSSNNGSDFAYLSQYDGKVCTVYLSPINCKATKSGAYFRFIPVLVEDDGFTFDEDYASEFAIKYYVKDQFQSLYNSDPSLEVIESVSNEDFNLENIPVSYSSSNTELLNFVKEDNKLIMHVYEGTGEVEVTLSASYKTVEYSEVIKINVDVTPIGFEYIGVKEAIDTEDGQEVIVHGIVASSLINQTGFYLADDTGIIAVRTDSTTMKSISLGNEVFMRGTRKHVRSKETNVGQSCIDNATLELNLFGHTPYSDASFIKDMSLTELLTHKNDQATVDMTAQAYVVKGHITKVVSSYSTNYYVSTSDKYEASTSFYLYAGSGAQYSAYDQFVGAGEVTITLALCDWNTKNEYRACLICVASETSTVINGYNFK